MRRFTPMIPTDSDFEFEVSMETETIPTPEDPPFHILFLGDFGGRENLSQSIGTTPPDFKAHEIDRDNFEQVMRKLDVRLCLKLTGEEDLLALRFNKLEDFHPDRIFKQIPLFTDLRETRERLLNPDSFESAALEVRSWLEESEENHQVSEDVVPSKEVSIESSGNLLDDILTGTKTEATTYKTPVTDSAELNSFIKDIVKPHLIETDEAEQDKLVSIVDEATSELMRKILHHPHFQALEAIWRGLYLTVRKTETSNDLKLFLMDVSKEELADNLKSVNDLTDSGFYKKVVLEKAATLGGDPFSIICGIYDFELNVDDVATLIRLAKIGNTITAPFISYVKPQMIGINSLAEKPSKSDWNLSDENDEAKLWTMLRTIPEATSLGLIIPKFLTRLPYGDDTEPTEVFSFEEFTEASEHKNYVWGNSAFIYALLQAQSFSSYGWEYSSRVFYELDGLPTHLYKKDGETKTKSCAEINMTHDACDSLIEQGLMPIISFRDTDSIKFADYQSISFPSKKLKSRWI